jgi:hypothetical protein
VPNPTYVETPWASKVDARVHWTSAVKLSDGMLDQLLAAADEAVRAYAPVLPDATPVPTGYLLATIYHAKEIRDAGQRDGDALGVGEFVIRARPLTAAVKQLLRPSDAFGGVG